MTNKYERLIGFACLYCAVILIPWGISEGVIYTPIASLAKYSKISISVFIESCLYVLCQYHLIKDASLISNKYKNFFIGLSVFIFASLLVAFSLAPLPEQFGQPNGTVGVSVSMIVVLIVAPLIVIPISVIQKTIFFVVGYTKTKNILDKSNLSMIPARILWVLLGGTVLFYGLEFLIGSALQLDIGNAYTEHLALSCKGIKAEEFEEKKFPDTNISFSLTVDTKRFPYHEKDVTLKSSIFYFSTWRSHAHGSSENDDITIDDQHIEVLETTKTDIHRSHLELDRLSGEFKYSERFGIEIKDKHYTEINGICTKANPL